MKPIPSRVLALAAGALSSLALLAPAAPAAPIVKVDGARLVDGEGKQVQLRGVNRSGAEYACSIAGTPASKGYSIFDGPRYDAPNLAQPQWTIDAMKAWGINAVRIPLSEHCWLGDVGTLNLAYSGASYREAITNYVDQLGASGMVAILDLHVAGPAAAPNLDANLLPLPDLDNAPSFWSQIANVFKTRTHVIYDVFNEPHLYELATDDARWACWRDGCVIDPAGTPPAYQAVGMTSLVNTIRATGSTQPIMLGGLGYSNLLARWREFVPADPAHALVASFHSYPAPIGECVDEACWDATIDAIRAGGYPVVTGELGDFDCHDDYLQRYLNWADAHGAISYLAWAWDETASPSAWGCGSGPAVIQSYDGTPTQTYGAAYRAHLLARQAPEQVPPPPPPVAPPPPTARTLRRSAVVGGNRRFAIAARDTKPAGSCVSNGERRAVRVGIALKRIAGRRAEHGFAIQQIRVLVDGRLQAYVIRRNVGTILRRGALYWESRTGRKPLPIAGRHVGSVELVTSTRPRRDARAVTGRTRLSIPFYICM